MRLQFTHTGEEEKAKEQLLLAAYYKMALQGLKSEGAQTNQGLQLFVFHLEMQLA